MQTGPFDGADMDEHVGAAGVGLNEPEAFRCIELFHCARSHGALLSNKPTNLGLREAIMSKVAMVGCGAMGSVYAALMVSAGHEVHVVTKWPDHAEAMATKGLRVEGASGDRTVRLASAGTSTDGIGVCDLVIIATKAFDVEAAARSCVSLIGPETVVQTIQNGLGSPEVAAPILGEDKIAVGVVGGFGASMRGPGHVHHNGLEMIRFGALRVCRPSACKPPPKSGSLRASRSASSRTCSAWSGRS